MAKEKAKPRGVAILALWKMNRLYVALPLLLLLLIYLAFRLQNLVRILLSHHSLQADTREMEVKQIKNLFIALGMFYFVIQFSSFQRSTFNSSLS